MAWKRRAKALVDLSLPPWRDIGPDATSYEDRLGETWTLVDGVAHEGTNDGFGELIERKRLGQEGFRRRG